MGNCCESRKSPFIQCYYEPNNIVQKNYCEKFINNIKNIDNIQYDIQQGDKFSILFIINGIPHIIKEDYDFREERIPIYTSNVFNIMALNYNDKYYHQHFIIKNLDNSSEIDFFFPKGDNIVAQPNIIQTKEDKKKLKGLEKNILKRQKENRSKNDIQYMDKNKKINQELEDMCVYGNIMKKQIKEEKLKNPEKFIEVKDALNLENQDQGLFALGLLGNNLQQYGTEVIIDKDTNDNEKDLDAGTTILQFVSNGMIEKKKYELHFDLGHQRNQEILENKNKYEEFKENLKEKLSKDYNIPKEKIIVTFPQKGSFSVQVIFQSDKFNDLNLNEFKQKFRNDNNYPELQNLKTIQIDTIMSGCKLKKNQLDARGNRIDGWGINENRGNKPYNPPLGWVGIGLKVLDKYDNGNNEWIGMNNSIGEWCVAYHGVGRFQTSDSVKHITGNIYKGGFIAGKNQAHENHNDQYHPGNKVGQGVYITPNINVAEGYSGESIINGQSYKTVLMVRVKPSAIRGCVDANEYWVVNGTTDEIRPYRILYKKTS